MKHGRQKQTLRPRGAQRVMFLMALLATLSNTASVAAESLGSALAFAYDHSGLLDQNRALLRAADEDVAIASAALQPVVTWAANVTATFPEQIPGQDLVTAAIQLDASLLLFDGGATELGIAAQKETVFATRYSLLGVEQQVLYRAIAAYFEVQRNAEFVALQQSNLRLVNQELRASKDRLEVGEATTTDVLLAESKQAAARSQVSAAEGNLARAVEEFRVSVGRKPGALSEAPSAKVTMGVQEARAFAMRNHPSIKQVQHAVTAAEMAIERARLATKPRVTANAGLRLNQDLGESGYVGLNFGGPVYQGGQLDAQVRRAVAMRDSQRAQLHIVSHNLSQGVGNAFANLEVANAARTAFARQVRALSDAFEATKEEARLGAKTRLDVLTAEQNLLNARVNLVSATVDQKLASYGILSAMGLLTAKHLDLDVQLYDPEAYYSLVKDAPTARSEQGEALDRILDALHR